ncbi:hypothetical protein QUF56_12410 [Ureibacillus composti]|uniref:Uncharacterized protein n=1 Tax=Lysinibacillus composti TaxID=720633 RepID=A0A3N9UJM4_9BACI|nr:hypothetical protein [Lysinibacillus composti]MBM7607273.1 hypothetical protein [Lysinibacillus composti]MDM5334031.1 hypothetical protein [Ureibacillus composti]RQW76151.1 hypothetical protein EBB45_00970 [Lysinibacillus composti]
MLVKLYKTNNLKLAHLVYGFLLKFDEFLAEQLSERKSREIKEAYEKEMQLRINKHDMYDEYDDYPYQFDEDGTP